MYKLSNSARAGASLDLENPEVVSAVQQWLWYCASTGWDPSGTDTARWTHEYNQKATPLGWMLIQSPDSTCLDVYSLRANISAQSAFTTILRLKGIDPLADKAIAVLTAQRFKFPNVRFAYLGQK